MSNKEIRTVDMTPQRDGTQINARWWTETVDVHTHAWAVAKRLDDESDARRNDNLRHARLYSNRAYLNLKMSGYRKTTKPASDAARLTLNVIKSCVDTACQKISQSRPRPMFLTSGGDQKLKRRAKQLTKYLDGLFMATGAYFLGQLAFRDSLVFGIGIIKVLDDGHSVRFERVLPDEILVDEGDAFYGQPRQMHQRRYVSRQVLGGLFPKFADKISQAQTSFSDEDSANPDMIAVVESWHLPSYPGAKDGKRVVSISNATLVDEEWTHDYFPFAFLRWSEGLTGFFGQGLAEELVGIQIEINKILRNIQSAQNLCSVPRVFLESQASIPGAALAPNPEGLSVVRYQGTKPEFMTAPAMPGEVYAHLDRLERKAYEITGVSQMAASSKKPAGLDSGVALREYSEIQSERFVLVGQRYEEFFLQLARLAIDQSQALYEERPDLNVTVAVKGEAEKIKWRDVNLKRDQYLLQCFPTSLLPTAPAGRLAKIQELIQGGFISKDEGLALLDFPDLERSMSLNTSAFEDAMTIVEAIVEDGIYTTPEPYMSLPLCIRVGQSMYLKARTQGVSEEKLELLRRFIDDCNALAQPAAEQAPAPAAVTSAPVSIEAPAALPEPLPTSDLLPSVM